MKPPDAAFDPFPPPLHVRFADVYIDCSGGPQRCPACGATAVIEIINGYPTRSAAAAAERGECFIAGCCVDDDSATWACRACQVAGGRLGAS